MHLFPWTNKAKRPNVYKNKALRLQKFIQYALSCVNNVYPLLITIEAESA